LRHARLNGIYHENFKKGLGGKRGKPVPIIYREDLHDPGSSSFHRPPHPIWGAAWEFLAGELFPDNFEQTVRRKPVFGTWGCEAVKLRAQADQLYKDEMKFMGWRWVCPGCKEPVRTLYYPIPVLTMFDRWVSDTAIEKILADAGCGDAPAPSFACGLCHQVKFFSSVHRNAWNEVIGYLSAGLLYGCEVQKPAGFVPQRKRTRIRQLHCEAPLRRKVLARLSNGWSNFQIARDLGISRHAVDMHVYALCREEEVADRHALASKLNFAVSPPPNQEERAMTRRFIVRQMLLENYSLSEMCGKLSASRPVIMADIYKIYSMYGINGRTHGRQALARKLGVPFMSKWDRLREQIAQLRQSGMSYSQIAKEVGISTKAVCWHMAKIKKSKSLEAPTDSPITQPATTP
jgi:DNA-binding CsgD family transcriptional regulator